MNGDSDTNYVDARVTITDDTNISYSDDWGRKAAGKLLDDELTHFAITRLAEWIRSDRHCEREDLKLLGWHLYRLLFHRGTQGAAGKSVGDEFEEFYQAFVPIHEKDQSQRLRLTLVFHKNASKLATYPWEFLYMPRDNKGFFLAGEKTHLILTRFVPESKTVASLKPEEGKLRVMVAYSSPIEEAEIHADDVIEEIENLEGTEVEVKVWRNHTRRELTETINEWKPHILHFIGHGDAGKIALIREEQQIEEDERIHGVRRDADWCDTATFNELFADHKPRMVFLHACKGAAPSVPRATLDTFTNTARELIYSEIPAVIGMQFDMENQDASTFARVFYRALAKGRPIDEAVTSGRRELGQQATRAWGDRRFGTPLVYLQTGNPIIIAAPRDEKEPPQENGAAAADAQLTMQCPYVPCTQQIRPEWSTCPACGNKILRCSKAHPVAVAWAKCPICDEKLGGPGGAAQHGTASVQQRPADLREPNGSGFG